MGLVIIFAILGCIPATIAAKKGRSFFLWWIYGALLFIIALIHSLIINTDIGYIERTQIDAGMVKCPFCAEMIRPEAIKCKHCGSDIKKEVEAINTFRVSDMEFNEFFVTDKKGNHDINYAKIHALATIMKQANPGVNPTDIWDKNKEEIIELKNMMPSVVREKFEKQLHSYFS